MEAASAFDASESTAESTIACSGLRNRMDGAGNGLAESKPDAAAVTSANKEPAPITLASSAAPEQETPDLSGERGCFMLLVTLYALQGSLLGLASGTLPFIIQVCVFCSARVSVD